jgi:hypothetical protein
MQGEGEPSRLWFQVSPHGSDPSRLLAEGVKGNRYGHEEDPAWAAASGALHHDGAGLPETVSPAAADKERLTERTDRRMGGSGQRYDPPAKGDWLIKSRNSLPRTTRTTRTAVALGWVRDSGGVLTLKGKGRIARSPSRQIEAEQWDAVQAGLDKQPTEKAALGTKYQGRACPPGRGEAVDQAAELWIRQRPRPGVSVRVVRVVRGKNLLRFSSCPGKNWNSIYSPGLSRSVIGQVSGCWMTHY